MAVSVRFRGCHLRPDVASSIWRHWRRRFWWVFAPCLILSFPTVYLRFHYVVDLLTGAVVAFAGWWMGEKYEASTGSL
jgi:hypothetical protein